VPSNYAVNLDQLVCGYLQNWSSYSYLVGKISCAVVISSFFYYFEVEENTYDIYKMKLIYCQM